MTHNIQTSIFSRGRLHSHYGANLYQVVVNTEEGEYYEYEVEADTFAEATAQAEEMANSLMADITYIEVYSQEFYESSNYPFTK